jgi:NADH-quinone oxidoreductase subunit G
VIVGAGALVHAGAYEAARSLAAGFGASFNLLHTAASRVGALDLGFVTQGGLDAIRARAGGLKALFLLGADETDLSAFAQTFTVYIGTHGDAGAKIADVILPGAAYTEKHGTYVNMEGRVQLSEQAVDAPGEARVDWTILRALSDVLGKTLPFDSLSELRMAIHAERPHLTTTGITDLGAIPAPAAPASSISGEIVYPIQDFYLTNPIARSSPTLLRCSAEILHGQTFAEAAE